MDLANIEDMQMLASIVLVCGEVVKLATQLLAEQAVTAISKRRGTRRWEHTHAPGQVAFSIGRASNSCWTNLLRQGNDVHLHRFIRFKRVDFLSLCERLSVRINTSRVRYWKHAEQEAGHRGRRAARVLNYVDEVGLFLVRICMGESFITIASIFGITPQTANIIFYHVLKCFLEEFNGFIKWPDVERRVHLRQLVANRFPALDGSIGFLDGTLFAIKRPTTEQELYYNGKDRIHALKSLAVVLPDGSLACMTTGSPGSFHDSRLYTENIELFSSPENFSQGECLCADIGFPLTQTCLVPYRRSESRQDPRKAAFNIQLSRCRIVIEWVFTIFRSTFQLIDCKNFGSQRKHMPAILVATSYLFNMYNELYKNEVAQYFQPQ
eukprot:GILK01006500.1.p1 GENE.GILK01006500.1~~GILK01006500.1.p1  ORF type:complete len:381 (+),score=22.20 GILK01006500.1:208-1350(+)